MAEIANYRVDNNLGCGFMGGIFQRWNHWTRKSHVHSLPSSGTKTRPPSCENQKKAPSQSSRRRRSSSAEPAIPQNSNSAKPLPKSDQNPTRNLPADHPRTSTSQRKIQGVRRLSVSDAARSSTSSSNGSGQNHDPGEERKLRRESTPNSLELSRIVAEHDSKVLVKASSTSAIVLGHVGNLKQSGSRSSRASKSPSSASRAILALSRNLQEMNSLPRKNGFGGGNNTSMGNIVRRNSWNDDFLGSSSKLDPEALKRMGNEAYKQGRFKEALNFYDRAIALDSNKAVYHSNKSAALIGLDRLVEAVFESKEAIRIEPSYQRAHHRLATLYIRYHSLDQMRISLKEKKMILFA